jgi:ribA/ribD-fused uncharacterized protein
MKISGFFNEWRFLSNFWECPVLFEGIIYPSAENAYQAAKTLNVEDRLKLKLMDSKSAKSFGKKVILRDDWNSIKLDIMLGIVLDKFSRNSELSQKLIDTGDSHLEESNYWGDTYWGTCRGVGQNNLGKILMQVRSSL